MSELFEGQESTISGFPLQERAIARRMEKMLAEDAGIEFDEHGAWNDPKGEFCVAKRRDDGTFYEPEYFIAAPIELKTEEAEYRIYQV
ncbi:MAG: hypothetical protein HGA31_04840 [Candidatus Moranbacteria bacterium]|nr:hypothetical protein [Candidatus Moranbacteria bacterium]